MPTDRLYEKLQRLRGTTPSARGLEEWEGEGEASAGSTLKERLEALVRATASRGKTRVVPIEEVAGGKRVRNVRGEFLLVEKDVSLDTLHGHVSLSRLAAARPGSLSILSGETEAGGRTLEGTVFLDTETTGLSGGSGTAAFLTGIGFVNGDRFFVRQYFMRDYHEEPALFESLAEDLRAFTHLVTFNGRTFDIPLLEARFRLNRGAFPLSGTAHLDLLHPSRRLWKARLPSCRLQSLEGPVLGFRRVEDVPGEEIPRIYFDYLRSRDGRGIARIFEHNRLDILSLAALAARACEWVEGALAEDPRDVFSLARVLERAGHRERSLAAYERALEGGPGPVLVPALLRLGREAKREGKHAAAFALFSRAAEAGDLSALRALAIHEEHLSSDFEAALALTEKALGLLRGRGPRSLRLEFERRLARLRVKLERPTRAAATATPRENSRRGTPGGSAGDAS
jgi:uncharacterized protein YprB with RNaseH-like and TPR domain